MICTIYDRFEGAGERGVKSYTYELTTTWYRGTSILRAISELSSQPLFSTKAAAVLSLGDGGVEVAIGPGSEPMFWLLTVSGCSSSYYPCSKRQKSTFHEVPPDPHMTTMPHPAVCHCRNRSSVMHGSITSLHGRAFDHLRLTMDRYATMTHLRQYTKALLHLSRPT